MDNGISNRHFSYTISVDLSENYIYYLSTYDILAYLRLSTKNGEVIDAIYL